MTTRTYNLRAARLDDQEALERLITRSAREIGVTHYTAQQIEGALRGAFGVDTQLINDGTYFVAEDSNGAVIGCGGWSKRRTLFGGDQRAGRDSAYLDPAVDAAKIRAFFVDPDQARKGIASAILERCESEAADAGFVELELMGTLTGVPFYKSWGYQAVEPVEYEVEAGLRIQFVRMRKSLSRKSA